MMIFLLLVAAGMALFGFAAGIVIGGRLALIVSPDGSHEFIAFLLRWVLPFGFIPVSLLGAGLLLLSRLTTRMAKGLIGSVAGDGGLESRRMAAGALGAQLNRTLGRPVLAMRLIGGGLLLALIAGTLLAAFG